MNALPQRNTSTSFRDYVAEQERDPEMAAFLAEARKRYEVNEPRYSEGAIVRAYCLGAAIGAIGGFLIGMFA